jgi:hypothetical protein
MDKIMRISNSSTKTALVLLASFVATGACASIINGVVLDDATGKPIPGAFVVAEWTYRGADLVGSRSGCARMEIVRADEQGRYSLPSASWTSWGSSRYIYSYKRGYEWFRKKDEREPGLLTMRPFKGTAQERRTSFEKFASLRTCAKEIGDLENLRPLYAEADQEIDQLFPDEASTRYTFIKMLDRNIEGRKRELIKKGVK